MKKIDVTSLAQTARATIIVALLPILVFGSFVASVWKEKQIRVLLQEKAGLNEKHLQLQSQAAALEISIEQLSVSERLELYALDSLGMVQPDPLTIVAIERDKDGAVVIEEYGFKAFINKLLGL